LYDYYVSEIIPQKLSKFLEANENKTIRKSFEIADLREEDAEKYYQLGKEGDEKYREFYEEFLSIKKEAYVNHRQKGKSHNISMRESLLSEDEYDECKDDLDELLRKIRFRIVLESISNNKTSTVAARNAGVSLEEVYDWYFKGRDGVEEYVDFYEDFHHSYVRPSAVPIQEKLDNENASIDNLIRSNKHLFTKRDFDIWLKNGIVNVGVFHLEKDDTEENDDDTETDDNNNEVKEININKFRKAKKSRSSLGKIIEEDYDVEELKRQILKK